MVIRPKLSVVIPVYNGESYLCRCLDSVFNQSLKDIQVIVVDDGSRDKTIDSILPYKQRYTNLAITSHPENRGTGVARNTGLSLATGKYIAFLDADDWVDTNAYLEMVTALEETGADIAICGIRTEHSNSLLSSIRYQYSHTNLISSDFALKLLCKTEMQDSFISPMVGNKVFNLDFLKKIELVFPPSSLFEDDEFMFLAFCYTTSAVIVPNVYQHYFQRESSAMHRFSDKYIDCLLQAFQNIRDRLSQDGLIEAYKNDYFAFLDRCLSSLLDTLFSCEQSTIIQRNYLMYLLEKLLQAFSMQELLAHIEPSRIHRIWLRS